MPHSAVVSVAELRAPGAILLGVAAALPRLPGSPGIPCGVRAVFGVPCPLCGTTTSVTATVHLDLGDALAASPAGIVVVIAAVVVLVVRREARLVVPVWAVAAGLLGLWLFQLVRFDVI